MAIATRTLAPYSAAGFAPQLHPVVMLYGFFPFFVFGFAFTAGPRWLGAPPLASRDYALPGFGMGLAFLFLIPALQINLDLTRASLAANLFFAAWLWLRFTRLINSSRSPDRIHIRIVQVSLAIGLLALANVIVVGFPRHPIPGWIPLVAVWFFLVPLFCSICHRMLPFFTANALAISRIWRPQAALWAMVGASWLHGALSLLGFDAWRWVIDAPAALLLFVVVWRWGLMQSLSNRLLAMLHLSLLWLAIAYLLFSIQSFCAWRGVQVLGLGPMHAITIGFLTSLAIAMVTRVTYGHSGRTLAADRLTWYLFLAFQAAAVTRIGADVLHLVKDELIAASSALWTICLVTWGIRNARIYLAPRSDGMPG